MEAAQALYGVTMQEPGVPNLVSVKFKAAGGMPAFVEAASEEEKEAAMA